MKFFHGGNFTENFAKNFAENFTKCTHTVYFATFLGVPSNWIRTRLFVPLSRFTVCVPILAAFVRD